MNGESNYSLWRASLFTGIPELVTSVIAATKKETGLAVGNVIGSNIFNLLLILGTSAALHPVAVNFASFYDLIVLIAMMITTYFFLRSKIRGIHKNYLTIFICLI